MLRLLGLLLLSSAAFVRCAAPSFDVAAGAIVTASSTYTSGVCTNNQCAAANVVNNNASDGIYLDWWQSNPTTCSPSLSEYISIDWFSKYKIQYLTEVRFRYGPVTSGSPVLVIFSELPLNVPEPTAVTYTNDNYWTVFVFTVPVTASGIKLILNNLSSVDGQSCYTSIAEIQAWVGGFPLVFFFCVVLSKFHLMGARSMSGTAPDAALAPATSSPAKGLNSGAVAGIIVAIAALVLIVAGVWIVRARKMKLIKSRLSTSRSGGRSGEDGVGTSLGPLSSQGAAAGVSAPPPKNARSTLNTLSPRMANFLEAQQQEQQQQQLSGGSAGFIAATRSS
ncbi:hypothetical protein DFJ73DRAFT_896633 [Zopfochytrium polystomum]|nr:hypothetical protein DFJ73DRAFT_896633 [Zopfochytrium polystomum]